MQVSGTIFYYTDLPVVRWDMLKPDDFRRIAGACRTEGRTIYAVLFPHEISELRAFTDHLPGPWTQVGAVRQVTVWRYESAAAP